MTFLKGFDTSDSVTFFTEKNRGYVYVLISFLTLVIVLMTFGRNGLFKLYRLKREKATIATYNETLKAKNKAMRVEIARLKSDKEYISKVAREELGMIGENEVIYRFDK